MTDKPRNPFLPGQPATVDLFVGRRSQIDRLLQRGARQTSFGKPTCFFIEGEYGIGKSSLANYCMLAAENEYGLLGVTASMAGQSDVDQAAEVVLKALIQATARDKSLWRRVSESLGKYVKDVHLFGVDLDLSAVRQAAPQFADVGGFLDTLRNVLHHVQPKSGSKAGVFLVLDEINGIAANPQFAHFLKGIVDRNALADSPVPMCLVLCGTPERRRELIASHEPVGRIFDVIDVPHLSGVESEHFFQIAFESVGMTLDPSALGQLAFFGYGQPRILHMLGDQAFWLDTDGRIDDQDVAKAVVAAAEDFTTKYIGPQILKELRSPDYRSILKKISSQNPTTPSFKRAAVAGGLEAGELKKLDNFLQRMKDLNVIRSGDDKGEWVFNTPMVRTAMFLMAQAPQS